MRLAAAGKAGVRSGERGEKGLKGAPQRARSCRLTRPAPQCCVARPANSVSRRGDGTGTGALVGGGHGRGGQPGTRVKNVVQVVDVAVLGETSGLGRRKWRAAAWLAGGASGSFPAQSCFPCRVGSASGDSCTRTSPAAIGPPPARHECTNYGLAIGCH